jgi:hypothetical protein
MVAEQVVLWITLCIEVRYDYSFLFLVVRFGGANTGGTVDREL